MANKRGKFRAHYLFTKDSTPKQLATNAIETAVLPRLFFEGEGHRPQSVLLILDTCYAGEGTGQVAAAIGAVKQTAFDGNGAGFYLLASAGPNDTADDGALVDAFLAAVADQSYFGAGGARYLHPEEIWAAINERFTGGQLAKVDLIGGGTVPQTFIRNIHYVPFIAGSTLEDIYHWDLKARGVEAVTLAGDYFVGREVALKQLRNWLTNPASDRRARVVTGKPGSGKSAVLGRLVMELQRGSGNGASLNVSIHAHRLSVASPLRLRPRVRKSPSRWDASLGS